MKKYLFSALLLGITLSSVNAQRADTRTVETRIADLLAQTPADNARQLLTNAEEIAALGKPGIVQLVTGLSALEMGQRGSLEFAIGGFTYYVNQPERENWRKLAAEAYAEALPRLSDINSKAFVLSQLQQIDKGEGLKVLTALLEDRELAGPAARALAQIATPGAGEALLKGLANPGDRQLSLIEALGDMQYQAAAPVLERLAAGEEAAIRKVSQYALARIGAPSSEAVLAKAAANAGWIYETSNATASYLQYLNRLSVNGHAATAEKAADALLKKATGANQGHTRAAALSILASAAGEKSVPTLVKAAESTNAAYRGAALSNLGRFAGPAITGLLVKSLAKGTPDTKADILSFLGNNGSSAALPAAVANLASSNTGVKLAAIAAVGKLGGEGSIAKLLPLLKTGNTAVVGAVAGALQTIKGAGVVKEVAAVLPALPDAAKPALINVLASRAASDQLGVVSGLLSSKNTAVQSAAFAALKTMAGSKDLPQLFSLLNTIRDPDHLSAVQDAVKGAVKGVGSTDQQTGLLLGQLNQTADKSAFLPVLAGVGGKQALQAVVSSFAGGDARTKQSAVAALSNWSDNSALDELYAIGKNAGDPTLQQDAVTGFVKTIGRSGDNPVQKVLQLRKALEMAQNSAQKKLVINELQKNKTFGALLIAGNYLEDPELQQAAAQAVMNIGLSGAGFSGPDAKRLLNRTMEVLKGADSDYQKEAIRKHLASLPQEEGFVSLFNGKDLTGWKGLVANPIKRAAMSADSLAYYQKRADEVMRTGWVVENGELMFTGKGQNICTEKAYGDIEMYVDWKLDADGEEGDAGIYLRGSPQVQIWDTSRVKVGAQVGSGGLYNNQVHPSIPTKVADNALGEWNTFYIKMVGDRVTVDLNGERVVDNIIMENLWDRKQPIFPIEQLELQAHGTKVYYRDIYVKELPRVEPFQLSEAEKKDGYKVLFDGTNMHEWTGSTENYFIENGDMVIVPKGRGGGNLFTKDEYADFNFRFEFQLTPGANNGLGIRAPLEGDAAYVGAAELQILDDTAPIYKNLEPYQYHGSVYGIIAAKRGHLKPVGEWNYEEVVVQGSKIKVILNGTTIVDGDLVEATKNGIPDKKEHPGLHRKTGHIGFLGHGSVVRFRNIRIKDLTVQKEEPVVEQAVPGKKGKKKKVKK